MICALLNGTTVDNVIVVHDKEECEAALGCVLVEITDDNPAGMRWTYNPDTGRFTPPVEETAVD